MIFILLEGEGEYGDYVENITHVYNVPKGTDPKLKYRQFLCRLANNIIGPKSRYYVDTQYGDPEIRIKGKLQKGENKKVKDVFDKWPIVRFIEEKMKCKKLQFETYLL